MLKLTGEKPRPLGAWGCGVGMSMWRPCVNLYDVGDAFEFCISLAGLVDAGDVKVELVQGELVVWGEIPSGEPQSDAGQSVRVLSMEIDYGRFCRRIALPGDIQKNGMKRWCRDGMLWVRLGKKKSVSADARRAG